MIPSCPFQNPWPGSTAHLTLIPRPLGQISASGAVAKETVMSLKWTGSSISCVCGVWFTVFPRPGSASSHDEIHKTHVFCSPPSWEVNFWATQNYRHLSWNALLLPVHSGIEGDKGALLLRSSALHFNFRDAYHLPLITNWLCLVTSN